MNIAITHFAELTERVLDDLSALEQAIFEAPTAREVLNRELSERRGLLILIAYEESRPCGFKVGYEYSTDTFFSLNGGVAPEFRRRGVAMALMNAQHEELRRRGYAYVRTHTKNKYRDMLILSIRSGFEVTGVYKSLKEQLHGIILEKKL